jgi:4-hydroxy-3-polyprenylbenzoate decarboxylase
MFCRGPLDVLDHSAENNSLGGKVGIDATFKLKEEETVREISGQQESLAILNMLISLKERDIIKNFNISLFKDGIPIIILSANPSEDHHVINRIKSELKTNFTGRICSLIILIDHTVDNDDWHKIAWQVLGNSDPERDHEYIFPSVLMIDGTIKAYREGGFSRRWPNVVCSSNETISAIDNKWQSLDLGVFIPSPSIKNQLLCRSGKDEIIIS